MRTKALHFAFLREDYSSRSELQVLKEIINIIKEAKSEFQAARGDEVEVRAEWSLEEEGQDSIARKLIEALKESVAFRNRSGFVEGEEEVKSNEGMNDIAVPLDHLEAHEKILRETRELNAACWRTLKKSKGVSIETMKVRGAWIK